MLHFFSDTTQDVSCGKHTALKCTDCPPWGWGADWCNGECAWTNDQCVPLGEYDSLHV